MLSLGKLTAGRASYYVDQLPDRADEYYTRPGDEDGQARWVGRAAGRLGLAGEVTPGDFRAVLDARHPTTLEPLGIPHTTGKRVAGFDLCYSAPKSVSVAWALAPPPVADAIIAAHDQAVIAAFSAFEAEAVRARRGAGGHAVVETAGVVAATFPHRSSRAGDPQIHTHVVVPNLTPGHRGRWSALYGARVYRWAKTLGYLYQAELRNQLSERLGVSWSPVRNGVAEIDGLPSGLLDEFSTRRHQIEAALEQAGTHSPRAAQTATLATRPAKHTVADLDTLRTEWSLRAVARGATPDLIDSLSQPPRAVTPDIDALNEELRGPTGLTLNHSTFDRRDVLQALAQAHPDGAPVDRLRHAADALIDHEHVVALASGTPAGPRYSTAELLATERALIDKAQQTVSTRRRPIRSEHIDAALAARPTLSDEQKTMVRTITTTDAAAIVVIGRAGPS